MVNKAVTPPPPSNLIKQLQNHTTSERKLIGDVEPNLTDIIHNCVNMIRTTSLDFLHIRNDTTLSVVFVCFITHAHITCTASLLPDRRQTAFGH